MPNVCCRYTKKITQCVHVGILTTYSNFLWIYRHAMTKHQYYLQLRKDILEERVRCGTEDAMLLASLALQAEFGDYQPEVPTLLFIYLLSVN